MRTSAAEICPICTDFTAVYENSSGFYIDPYIYGAIALPPKVELGLGYDNYVSTQSRMSFVLAGAFCSALFVILAGMLHAACCQGSN